MAINKQVFQTLLFARSLGVGFENLLVLGRQQLFINQREVDLVVKRHRKELDDQVNFKSLRYAPDEKGNVYAEELLQRLGAKKITSLDFSAYEGCDIIHDLNHPIPDSLKGKYTCLFDGGTLEHVFNFPQALKNCMELLQTGGHFISSGPANNLLGHGFFQLSPELYYRALSPENGFQVIKILLYEDTYPANFYEVIDPDQVKKRVKLINSRPTGIFVIAKKLSSKAVFEKMPMQSDYVNVWNNTTTNAQRVKRGLRKYVPHNIKSFFKKLLYNKATSQKKHSFQNSINYKRIKF